MYKLTVKCSKENKDVLRTRGIFHSDPIELKALVNELRSTKNFTCFVLNENDLQEVADLYQSIGLQVTFQDNK
jgi:hypothetical protein